MTQLRLFPSIPIKQTRPMQRAFSHNQVCSEDARIEIEERYSDLLEETDKFNRQLVSFQANKTELLHNWVKYREGFSAALVEMMFDEFGLNPGDTVLDPFAGSCTTLLVAKMLGINASGIELLPHCHLAWKAKSRVFDYDLDELRDIRRQMFHFTPPPTDERFPHLAITQTAFAEQTEQDLMAYTQWADSLNASDGAKALVRCAIMSILEQVSFTRKDGQYLRWDGRAGKIRERNRMRMANGTKPIQGIDKGDLPTVREAFVSAFGKMLADIADLQQEPPLPSRQALIEGNTLRILPTLEKDQFAAVFTSPPYANRYDYTRTYALELAYLGVGEDIFGLRQRQLSCTVENRSKLQQLGSFYQSIGQGDRFARIMGVIERNEALSEVNAALRARSHMGEINNEGVLTMIDQYFTEITFVFAELYRVCQKGAQVAFVNDNVRYAGEIIPVDTLSTSLAEQVGFEPMHIYVLPQRKGNSSQQMKKYGRVALRKSITVWRKP